MSLNLDLRPSIAPNANPQSLSPPSLAQRPSLLAPGVVPTTVVPSLPGWSQVAVPELARPQMLDADSLAALLGELQEAITREQLSTGLEGIKLNDSERKELHRKAKEELETAQRKAREAAEAAEKDKIGNWFRAVFGVIGAVFGVVAAVVGAVASGGVATPLVVAAAMGALMAVQDLANMAIKEAGVEITDVNGERKKLDISFGGMVEAIVAQQIHDGTIVEVRKDDNGNFIDKKGNIIADPRLTAKAGAIVMDEKQLTDWKMGWTVTAGLLVAATTIAAGAGGMVMVEKAAKSATQVADKVSRAAQATERIATGGEIAAEVGEGAAAVTQGVVQLEVAGLTRDSDRARAQKAFYDNMVKDVTMRMNMTQDLMKELVSLLNESYEGFSAAIAAMADTRVTTARNMS